MAKSALELAVETGKWDGGLKKAKQALDNFTQTSGGLQSALDADNDKMTQFIQMLGNMDSTANTTKGQLRELTQITTDLTIAYRGLTDEEKNSPFGKALAASIDKLTTKAGIMRDAMDDVQQSVRNMASDTRLFDQMAQGASVLTSGFQGLMGAGKLLGINMGDNVEVIAKLQAAMAVTNSLTTIQNALQKQSALMQGLAAAKATLSATAHGILAGEITAATIAQKAFNLAMKAAPWALAATAIYTVVDALGIFSSDTNEAADSVERFNEKLEDTERILGRIKLQNTFDDALSGYLGGSDTMTNFNRTLDKLEKRRKKLLEETNKFDKNPITGQVVLSQRNAYNKVAEEYNNVVAQINQTGAKRKAYEEATYAFRTGDMYKKVDDQGAIRLGISYYEDLIRNLKTTEEYDQVAKDYNDRIEYLKSKLRQTGSKGGKGGKGGKNTEFFIEGSLGDLNKQVQELQKEQSKVTDATGWEEYAEKIRLVKIQIKELKGELVSVDENGKIIADPMTAWSQNKGKVSVTREVQDNAIESVRKEGDSLKNKDISKQLQKTLEGVQASNKESKQEKKYVSDGLTKLAGGLNGLDGGLKSLGIDLGDGFRKVVNGITVVSTILTSISTILTAIEAISAADALIPFARGGIVKAAGGTIVGNSYSGDNLRGIGPGGQIYGLNAGEVVLNRSQVGNLAAQLQGDGLQGIQLEAVISGEQLLLVQNNRGLRTGRGEIVQSKRMR